MMTDKKLKNTGIKEEVIRQIREIAARYHVDKVVLFGSRARGDFSRASDIDLAVSGGDFRDFCLDVDEQTSTLLQFDFVNLDDGLEADFLENIERDGVLLYEKI